MITTEANKQQQQQKTNNRNRPGNKQTYMCVVLTQGN